MATQLQNWQLCLEWLKAITNNQNLQNHDLRTVKDELGLYSILKDGVILARMIFIQGNRPVSTAEINHNTQNVFSLEEENIKLFLRELKATFSLIEVFGSHESQVFKEFDDFHFVLEGLSRVSKSLASKSQVPGFDLAEQQKKSEFTSLRPNYQTIFGTEKERRYVKEKSIPFNLHESVKELRTFHLSHCKNVLHVIDSFSSILCARYPHNVLARHLLPSLRIRELVELHDQLQEEFNILEIDYEALEDIFSKYSDKFLIYCYVCSNQDYVLTTFKSKMQDDPNFMLEVKHAFTLVIEKDKSAEFQPCLEDLLQMLQPMVMRFELKLNDISKTAEKAGFLRIQRSSANASAMIKNVLQQINAYVSDSNHMEKLYKLHIKLGLPQEIFPDGNMFLTGNHLTKIVKDIEFKNGKEEEFNRCKLYIFEKMIIVMKISVNLHLTPWLRTSSSKKTISEEFGDIYFIKDFERPAFLLEKHLDKAGQSVIQLESFSDGRVDLRKTIQMRCEIQGAKYLYQTLLELQEKSEQLKEENIKPGIDHQNHQFNIYAELLNMNCQGDLSEIHKRCAQCKQFFYGKHQVGIFCFDHKDYFCFNCFQASTRKKDINDHAVDTPKVYMDLFDLKSHHLTAADVLLNKSENSYLMRTWLDNKRCIYVKRKHKIEELPINEEEFNGKIWLSLMKGIASTDLIRMIEKSKDVLQLHHPCINPTKNNSLIDLEDAEKNFEDCIFFDIPEQEIIMILSKMPPGTFLLNSTSFGSYVYKTKTSGKGVKRTRLEIDEDGYVSFQKTYIEKDSLENLLKYCKTLPDIHPQYLTKPLEIEDAESLDIYKSKTVIPYITGNQAHHILHDKNKGQFLTMKTFEGKVRISFKDDEQIAFYHVMRAGLEVHDTSENSQEIFIQASIRNLKSKGLISSHVITEHTCIPILPYNWACLLLEEKKRGEFLIRKNFKGEVRISSKEESHIADHHVKFAEQEVYSTSPIIQQILLQPFIDELKLKGLITKHVDSEPVHTYIPILTTTQTCNILQDKSTGAFLIWKNEKEEVWISYKKESNIINEIVTEKEFQNTSENIDLLLQAYICNLKSKGLIANQVIIEHIKDVKHD